LNAKRESGSIITLSFHALTQGAFNTQKWVYHHPSMPGVEARIQALSTRVSIALSWHHLAKVVTLPVIHLPMSWSKAMAPWKTLSRE
jgi:hypothetical protein